MTDDLYSERAERAVAALAVHAGDGVSDAVLDRVEADDFASLPLRRIMQAVAGLRAEGQSADPVVVAARIGGENAARFIDELSVDMPSGAAVTSVCTIVTDLARWRRRRVALGAGMLACEDRDADAFVESLSAIDAAEERRRAGGWLSPHDLMAALAEQLENHDQTRYPWPLPRLNEMTGGGARPGQVTFVGGPSSHGKSAFVDMALHSMAEGGARAALFLNEMTAEERAERIAARLARVEYGRIQAASAGVGRMTIDETRRIIRAMTEQPVSMVPCAGWSVQDVTREARRRRLDVLALDIVQKLPFEKGRKRHETLEAAVQHVDAFAKSSGCHVLLVGQLNRARAQGTWPMPALSDVKDCAELVNGPDNVLFVWREQNDQSLDPLPTGVIRVAKYRGCRVDSVPVSFSGDYQVFVEERGGETAADLEARAPARALAAVPDPEREIPF